MKYKIDIKFSEKILTFHFGLSFLGYFYDKYDLDVYSLYEKIQTKAFSFIPLLMFESYKHNLERQGKEVDLTKEDIADLIDENGGLHEEKSSASLFLEAFINSILVRLGQDNKEEKKSDSKKK